MIRLENTSLRYEQGRDVLSRVNLDIPAGAFRFLTGPSGAGKTSLLKLIFLAHAPSEGRITLMGEDVTTANRKKRALLRRQEAQSGAIVAGDTEETKVMERGELSMDPLRHAVT